MRRTGKAIGTLAAAMSLALLGGGLALADDVVNTLDTSPDVTLETLALKVGDGARTATLTVRATTDGMQNNNDGGACNINFENPLRVQALSSNTAVATVQSMALEFTSCGQTKTVSISPVSAGEVKITFDKASGPNNSKPFDYSKAAFKALVAPSKQDQTITFASPTTPRAYGDSFVVAPTSDSGLAVTLAGTGSCSTSPGPSTDGFTVTMNNSTGTCTLTASQPGSDSFNSATAVVREVAAQQRGLSIVAAPKAKTYGDADPVLTYESSALAFQDALTGDLAREPGENVDTYAINQGTVTTGNSHYDVTFTPANLTVGQRVVDVVADPLAKTYGDADPALTYSTPTNRNLLAGDMFTGDLQRLVGEDVGPRAITLGNLSAGSNYSINFTGASLTINKRSITVTAQAGNKTYGDTDPALTSTITSGNLVGNDELTGDLARVAGENVNTYAINQGTVSAGNNYDLTYVGANFTINKRPITVAAEAGSKTYGDTDPAWNYSRTSGNLVGNDELTGDLARVAGENVNTYAINQGTVTAGNNYDLTYVGANFTINKRNLAVTADAKTKEWGEADPALTYTHGALFGNDQLSGSLTRAAGENAGMYAITRGTLSAGDNYNIQFTGANLTIRAWTYGAGFKSPVSMDSSKVNQLRGGSTVPLKFNVFAGGIERTADIGTVFARTQACDNGDTANSVPVESAGSTSLRYDTTGAQWVYNWKAPSSTGCYKVGVMLKDGTVLATDFKVTK